MVVQTPLERSRPVLAGVRWSTAVRCPRAAVYEWVGAPARDYSEQEERWFRRGAAMGRLLADDIAAGFREQHRRVRREIEVPWPASDPIGVGHADVWIGGEDRTIVECFSTAGGALSEVKAVQAAGYAVNHPRARRAAVVSIDPHTFEDHTYPIDVAALEPRVHDIEDQVVAGVRQGVLPGRVCETPSEGYQCVYCDHCFEDWSWPASDELFAERDVLAELASARDNLADARSRVRAWEVEVSDGWARVERLLPRLDQAGKVEATANGYKVSVSAFPVERFSLADARKAGHTLDAPAETLAAFTTLTLQHRRRITRLGDCP